MTKIKRFSLIVALTLASALWCGAQEQQAQEVETNTSSTTAAVGPINGQGTAGKIAKFTGTNAIGNSVLTENAARIGINISPTAVLHINKPQPKALAGNGYTATTLLQTSGGKGGNTTGMGTTAGAGASIFLTAGNGGDAPAGSIRGNGGNITLMPGSRGNTTGSGEADFGLPGNVLLAPTGLGHVGIGTNAPGLGKLHVVASDSNAVYGESDFGTGVYGTSYSGVGVYGTSSTGLAGRFVGKVLVNGPLITTSNIFITHPNSLIITSPDSKCWQIRVSNTGVLAAASVACP